MYRQESGFQRRSFAPVKVGDELDVKIEAVGEKGDGIAKKDGFVLFVPGVKAGDNVRIRVTRVLRKVGFAEVVGGGGESAPVADAPQEQAAAPEEEQYDSSQDSEDFSEEEPSN
ncbi:TRAM domain-containing protein [Candidatus Woesearchaeota archaeon]|nr:TRAM domain-containing protein [Candidatus Woesearchaeota archaeon]